MANFQYKSTAGGSWTDVPSYAVHGTYEGNIELVYPPAEQFDGLGRPCGAVGQPSVRISSGLMTASGMVFWQSFFSAASNLSASIWLKVFDPRSTKLGASAWTTCSGYLLRPAWKRIKVGGDSPTQANTWYYGVEIVVNNCDTVNVT